MTSRSVFIIDDADFVVDMLRLTFADGGYTVVGSATCLLYTSDAADEL